MRPGRLRWWIIGLVTSGTILNYLARSSLSVAAPTLKGEFGMTTEQYSFVVIAFQGAYTVMQPLAGAVLDWLGTRIGFAIFAIGWALSNMAHGMATGWQSLAVFRGLLGATEAAAIPGGLKVVSEWFPAPERTVATGWFNLGSSLGNMIAPPLVTFCILAYGWQSAFMVTGAISLLWAGLWLFAYRPPEQHPRLSSAERDVILGGRQAPVGAPAKWRDILRARAFWSIAIPRFFAEPAWQTFNFFIPLYLVATWQLDLRTIALWAWLPFLAADSGSLVGGYLAPFVMRRFRVSLLTSRKIVMTTGAILMAGPACIGLASGPGTAIALFCIGGFAHQMLSGALLTLAADVFDTRAVGTASGMAGSAAWIGGILFTYVIGQNADAYGYNPLFAALVALDLIAAAFLWVCFATSLGRAGSARWQQIERISDMLMTQMMRWFGPADPVSLADIRQAGCAGVVTALHEVPNGAIWPIEDILERRGLIEAAGMEWTVVESLPVHEAIKTRGAGFEQFIATYKASLANLAQCGLKVITYNFMPLLDWTRTDLAKPMPDGALALGFEEVAIAAFDLFMLARPGAGLDYPLAIRAAAADLHGALSEEGRLRLEANILAGLPGSEESFTAPDLLEAIGSYAEIDAARLRDNLVAFLADICPTADACGLQLAIHPDDPPFPIFGLPRVVSTEADVDELFERVPNGSNGLCLCTGSFGVRADNDLPGMVARLASRIHFLHLRNVARTGKSDFHEATHLGGDVDMFSVVREVHRLSHREGRSIPMRPDHGHQILDDLKRPTNPGYSSIGRLRGLAELRGLELAIARTEQAA